jgi:NADH:ubiquinone oxidoreductase subunit 2 (subunit N)
MAGVPPMAGFFSKFYMLLFSMTIYDVFVTSAGLLSSLVGAYYYLRFIQFILFEPLVKNKLNLIPLSFSLNERGRFIAMLSQSLFILIELNA